MGKFEFSFDTQIVSELRKAMNDKLNITTKKKNDFKTKDGFTYYSWSRMCAAMDRIEDTLKYINRTAIGNRGLKIAFDFYEFLNNEYVVIESIKTMAKIFNVNVSTFKTIETANDSFNQKVPDADFFSYLRSLMSVHPVETTKAHHKSIMIESNLDCCPRAFWTEEVFGYKDDSDITMQIYAVNSENYHSTIPLCVSSFEKYLNKWIAIIPEIITAIHKYNAEQYDKFRLEKLKTLADYNNDEIPFLYYLKNEFATRFDGEQEYLFDYYIDVLRFQPSDKRNNILLEKYQAAIKRAIIFLRNGLQNMTFSGFENTGIYNDPNFETHLFNELYYPTVYYDGDFNGYGYNLSKLDHLENGDFGDRHYSRILLGEIKDIVNKFVYFTNEESEKETVVLVRMALYFNALACDCLLNKSMPNDLLYRNKLLSQEEHDELFKPKDELKDDSNLDPLKELFKKIGIDTN